MYSAYNDDWDTGVDDVGECKDAWRGQYIIIYQPAQRVADCNIPELMNIDVR